VHFLFSEANHSYKEFVLVVFKDKKTAVVVPLTRVVGGRGQSYKVKWSDNKEYKAVGMCTGT